MQLRDWLVSDHAGILGRFDQGIAPHVPQDRWTERADGGGSSIAALLYHLSRHQDLAVNVVVRGTAAVWDGHAARLGVHDRPATAGLSEAEDPTLTALLDLDALDTYARAVHATTQEWLVSLDDESLVALLDGVPPTSERLEAASIARAEVPWLHGMWGDKTVTWLLQWPGIGHGHAHVGEITSIRNRLGLSPF